MGISLGAALIGSAVLGAASSIIGGSKASNAAQQSAQVQADAAQYAADKQFEQYNITRNDLAPYRQAGQGALSMLQNLMPQGNWSPNDRGFEHGATPQAAYGGKFSGGYGGLNASGQIVGPDGRIVTTQPGSAAQPGSAVPLGTQPGAQILILPDGTEILYPGAGTVQEAPKNQLDPNTPLLTGALGANVIGEAQGKGGQSAQSGYLTALEKLGPNVSGEFANPLLRNLQSWIPGSGEPENNFLTDLKSFSPAAIAAGGPANPALQGLNALLGFGDDGNFSAVNIQRALENTPGYKFTLDQGLKSIQNSYTAKGLGSSGAALKGAADYSAGLASQTYQQQLNNYLNSYNSQFANTFNAAGQQFNNAFNAYAQGFNNANDMYKTQFGNALQIAQMGQNAGVQTGTIGQQAASNAGGYLTSGAAAQAAGIVGSSNALVSGITGVANSLGQAGVGLALAGGGNGGIYGNYAASNPFATGN